MPMVVPPRLVVRSAESGGCAECGARRGRSADLADVDEVVVEDPPRLGEDAAGLVVGGSGATRSRFVATQRTRPRGRGSRRLPPRGRPRLPLGDVLEEALASGKPSVTTLPSTADRAALGDDGSGGGPDRWRRSRASSATESVEVGLGTRRGRRSPARLARRRRCGGRARSARRLGGLARSRRFGGVGAAAGRRGRRRRLGGVGAAPRPASGAGAVCGAADASAAAPRRRRRCRRAELGRRLAGGLARAVRSSRR